MSAAVRQTKAPDAASALQTIVVPERCGPSTKQDGFVQAAPAAVTPWLGGSTRYSILFGTGSYVPSGTSILQDSRRRNVISSPRRIPRRRTAWIEYSEHVGS